MTSILPHNIVNDTQWYRVRDGRETFACWPGRMGKVEFWRVRPKVYRILAPLIGSFEITAPSLPAAKAQALALVREAILAEAEAWK